METYFRFFTQWKNKRARQLLNIEMVAKEAPGNVALLFTIYSLFVTMRHYQNKYAKANANART